MTRTSAEVRLTHHWPILFLISLSLFLNLYAITWGLPNIDDWASLSLAPVKPLSFAKHLLYREPWLYHYPPFHFIILALAYAPYITYLFISGGIASPVDAYPYGLTHPLQSLTILTLISRGVSVAMGVGIVVAHYYAMKKFYDRRAAFWAGFFIATSFPIIFYAHIANVDVPQLFWFSLAVYAYVSLLQTPNTKYYLLLGAFTAFSFTTKDSIYAIFIGIAAVSLILPLLEQFQSTKSVISSFKKAFDPKIVYGLIAFTIFLLLIFNPISNWEGLMFHINRHSLRSVRGSWVIRDAPSKLFGHLELIYHYLEFMVQSNGLLVFCFLVLGVVYGLIVSPKKALILMIPILTYYIFFLRIHGTYHLRYMLPIYLLLIWFAAKLCGDLWAGSTKFKILIRPLLGLVFVSSLVYGFSVDFLYANDCRYRAEAWIRTALEEDALILAIEPEYSLPRIPLKMTVLYRDLWDFDGNLIDDIRDVKADYIIVGMAIPRRQEQREQVDEFFMNAGYQVLQSFTTTLPWWVPRISNLHALYPEVTILRNQHNP